jgi:hypothetical protein
MELNQGENIGSFLLKKWDMSDRRRQMIDLAQRQTMAVSLSD